jgi:Uma2 family endonuclease
MTSSDKTRVTAEEFFTLPETMLPTQLIDGEIIRRGAQYTIHQQVLGNVGALLLGLSDERGGHAYIAPLAVYLDDYNVLAPDVMYLVPDSQCDVTEEWLVGPPELVVEIVMPETAKEDKVIKFRLYEYFGAREYWIVYPHTEFMEVYQLVEDSYTLMGTYFPGETLTSSIVGNIEVARIFGA